MSTSGTNRGARTQRGSGRGTRPGAAGAPFSLLVNLPTGPLPVLVERKRVRNLNLRVRADGSVHLSIPLRLSRADAQAFLDRRAPWIAEHRAARQQRADTPERLIYDPADGTVPLWGELVKLDDLLRAHGIVVPDDAREPDDATRLLADRAEPYVDELYRRAVERALPSVREEAEARVGTHAERWQVRRMTSRWGSCTPARKSIRISSTLAAYPPACLAMVVAHELVHLKEPNHGPRFHALLDAACPQNRTIAALLKQPPRALANLLKRPDRDPTPPDTWTFIDLGHAADQWPYHVVPY